MVMTKLEQKEDVKNVRNYFMFLKLVNIVLNVHGIYQNDNEYSRNLIGEKALHSP